MNPIYQCPLCPTFEKRKEESFFPSIIPFTFKNNNNVKPQLGLAAKDLQEILE